MAELFGYKKTLTRDGVGQVVNGFTPNPIVTLGHSPIVLNSAQEHTLDVSEWTIIRFRGTQNMMVTLYDEYGNETMEFPETANLPVIYILSHVVSIKFYNDSGDINTIYYQGS